MNFKGYGGVNNNNNNPIGGGGDGGGIGKGPSNMTLIRQPSSVYSLTFDEFQSTMGGVGKDFGSMNMDELLKNIWTAEETQALAMASSANTESNNINNNNNNGNYYYNPNGNLQRQGSLTLPRTLSQKTVDEVWRDLMKDSGSGSGGANGTTTTTSTTAPASSSSSAMPQRQQTLGEMTLEEFLVRAGVVREDNNNLASSLIGRPNGNGNNHNNNNQWFNSHNSGSILGFQHQPNGNNLGNNNNRMVNSTNPVSKQTPPLSLQVNPNPNPNRSPNPNLNPTSHQHHQPPLFPKPVNVAFAAAPPVHFVNNCQLGARGGGMMGVQGGGSPASQMSPEVMTKSTGDTSSLSPVPYVINRGRKCSAIEKVVERRQRRMIKNRESAARSRARKQAYTLELESEVRKLKDLNEELQRKQAEFMEMQKNQAVETLGSAWGGKRHCLRRTLTGPW